MILPPDTFGDAQAAFSRQQIGGGGGDGRMYAPNRDIAYIGTLMIAHAFRGFRDADFPMQAGQGIYGSLLAAVPAEAQLPELSAYAEFLRLLITTATLTDEDLVTAAARLRRDVAEKHKVEISWQTEVAVLSRLGEMLLGAIFSAMKDITPEGGQPPVMRDIASLTRVADEIAAKIRPPAS